MNNKNSSKQYTDLHYKDGSQIFSASHLASSMWNREGPRIIKKSRKEFTCVFGCCIPRGSTYVSLEMLAGGGCGTSCLSFALCEHHNKKTEALIGNPITSSEIETDEILKSWLQL